MYRGIFVFGLLVGAGSASAQQVYKCVNGKQVSYQFAPCPGQAQKAWDATPQAVDPYVGARIESMRQVQQQRARGSSAGSNGGYAASTGGGSVLHSVSQASDHNRCEQTKADRKRAYDVTELNRSFAMSSRWDGIVQNACKLFRDSSQNKDCWDVAPAVTLHVSPTHSAFQRRQQWDHGTRACSCWNRHYLC